MRGNYSLFQMWEPHRQSLINRHLFYVEQARKRLLSQFSDLESEEKANKVIEDWIQANGHRFNPDFYDEGDLYEEACDHYHALLELRDQTRLSIISGMYHEWEKQLHQWMVDQMRGWCPTDSLEKIVWKVNLSQLNELTDQLGWSICKKPYFPLLDACRLVVNVYKHGNGDSLQDLRKKHPEYLRNLISGSLPEHFLDFLDHTQLKVSDEHLQHFSDAIVGFWKDIPKDIYDQENSEVPKWLEVIFNNDVKASKKRQGGSKK